MSSRALLTGVGGVEALGCSAGQELLGLRLARFGSYQSKSLHSPQRTGCILGLSKESKAQLIKIFSDLRFMCFRLLIVISIVSVVASMPVDAACRTYHYDHDGNPHTPSRLILACEQSFEVRKIPKYKVPSIDVSISRTLVGNPKHIRLTSPKPKCNIPSVYHFTMMQTLSLCITTR